MSGRKATTLAAFALAALASGCDRPPGGWGRTTGDFGRAEPSVMNDTILPAAGSLVAEYVRGEPVSGFNRTDREDTLRDRAWTLVVPPHANDWIGDLLVEGQRTRLLPEIDHRYNTQAYYNFLRSERFASSEARWSRVLDDMGKDGELVGPFWRLACRVAADDRARMVSLDGRADPAVRELANATARVDENARVVDWVWRAMRFRLASYRSAIDRMAVETPTDRLYQVNVGWSGLQAAIAAAEAQDCVRKAMAVAAPVRPSRLRDPASVNEVVPQK
ncbi:hypothetical protein [Prosthecomicrobium sp. N25]|uniref:hypothetical protein n=1 Tax=Prosthecomicrobium sp. N25 TaxID=3129254 RepID=UPI003077349E